MLVLVLLFLAVFVYVLNPVRKMRYDYQNGKPVVVGIIGDSIACGYRANNWEKIEEVIAPVKENGRITQATQNDIRIGGWAQQLQAWLKQRNQNSIVHNFCGSGWTTRMVLERESVKKLARMTPKPAVVFISLATNDRLKDERNVGPEVVAQFSEYAMNLKTICQQCKYYGMEPVLVKEINEPLPAGDGWEAAEYHRSKQNLKMKHHAYSEYIQVVEEVARNNMFFGSTLFVVDVYSSSLNKGNYPIYKDKLKGAAPSDFRSDLYAMDATKIFDPIHPNQKGHDLILNQYKKFFLTKWWWY